MKFKQRLQRLEARQPKHRDLSDVPLEEWTDDELDKEMARLGGTLRTKDLRNLTDEELNRRLTESSRNWPALERRRIGQHRRSSS